MLFFNFSIESLYAYRILFRQRIKRWIERGLGDDSAGDPAIDSARIKRGIERRIKPDTCRRGITGVDQGWRTHTAS